MVSINSTDYAIYCGFSRISFFSNTKEDEKPLESLEAPRRIVRLLHHGGQASEDVASCSTLA